MPANSLRQQFLIQYTQSWGTKSNCATKIATFFSLKHMANDDTKTTNPFAALNFHHIYLWCQCQSSLHDMCCLTCLKLKTHTHTHSLIQQYLFDLIKNYCQWKVVWCTVSHQHKSGLISWSCGLTRYHKSHLVPSHPPQNDFLLNKTHFNYYCTQILHTEESTILLVIVTRPLRYPPPLFF